jgi:hypothetical protein
MAINSAVDLKISCASLTDAQRCGSDGTRKMRHNNLRVSYTTPFQRPVSHQVSFGRPVSLDYPWRRPIRRRVVLYHRIQTDHVAQGRPTLVDKFAGRLNFVTNLG